MFATALAPALVAVFVPVSGVCVEMGAGSLRGVRTAAWSADAASTALRARTT